MELNEKTTLKVSTCLFLPKNKGRDTLTDQLF